MSEPTVEEPEREYCNLCGGVAVDDLWDHRVSVHGWGKEDN